MKIICCPINGPRPLQEFLYGGELRREPDPATATDKEWCDYLYNRDGAPATKIEWWYHIPSGVWFLAERDTLRDQFVRTFLHEELDQHG